MNFEEYFARILFIRAVRWLSKFENIKMRSVCAEYARQKSIVEEMKNQKH